MQNIQGNMNYNLSAIANWKTRTEQKHNASFGNYNHTALKAIEIKKRKIPEQQTSTNEHKQRQQQ